MPKVFNIEYVLKKTLIPGTEILIEWSGVLNELGFGSSEHSPGHSNEHGNLCSKPSFSHGNEHAIKI